MKSEKNDRNECQREMYTKFCKTHPHEMRCDNTKITQIIPEFDRGFYQYGNK